MSKDYNVPVVGVGSSAGGLEALREMLSAAEVPTGLAFVVVQHLDPHHESMLAELLDRHTRLSVRQCEGGEAIEADTVFIIPPGKGLSIERGRLVLNDFAQPRGLRRPIDDFFISLANDQQSNSACVILSGTGADGSTGLRAIKENGGLCVVQEPSTAKYDGMPVSATGTGLVDFIRPPQEILACIGGFFFRKSQGSDKKETSKIADIVEDLCTALRRSVGHDFTGYKQTTFVRRVERRMHVLGIDRGTEYLARVQTDHDECDALFRDLLINVTRFFRDRHSFDVLNEIAITNLMRDAAGSEEGVRVWIPGCSSGEEAYTIAILFAEAARNLNLPCNVQIFATDIDESMLKIAREGSYPIALLADIPHELQEHYVIPHKERFNFIGQIRDMIRFSGHSLIKDPPFSKVDLVSCRNLLIYFDDKLQKTVMPLLHYAIRPGGFLFLGSSETVGRFDSVFSVIDQKARLFERLPGSPTYPIPLPGERSNRRPAVPRAEVEKMSGSVEELATSRLMERYVPASVVLDNDGQIVAAYGRLSRFFEFPVSGTSETSAFTLARPGVKEQLGALVRQAATAKRRVVARNVDVITDFGTLKTEIICDPLEENAYLVVFQESAMFTPLEAIDLVEMEPGDGHVEALERELRSAKHRLRSATEELETANEELKSSNEEMMSMNEELQSTNEELTTVNDELKTKIDEVSVANADLRNFFDSTSLAVIVLDDEMRLRSYTRAATAIFPLQPTDRGRPLSDVASRYPSLDFTARVKSVMANGLEYNQTVMDPEQERTFSLRILPYRTADGAIDGATIIMTDISHALSMESQLAAEQERHELAIEAAGIGVWEYLPDHGEFVLGGAAMELLQTRDGRPALQAVLQNFNELDRQQLHDALDSAVHNHTGFELTSRITGVDGRPRWLKTFARHVADSNPDRVIGVSVDVTAEYELAEARELMLSEMNHRVKNLFAMIGGILRMSARKHETIKSLVEDVEGRILALGSAHSLASNQKRTSAVPIHDLLDTILTPYNRHAVIDIRGKDFLIAVNCITPLTLILHEWSTNALKHGVLGKEGGELRIDWEEKGDHIDLVWNEIGTVPVEGSGVAGFGTVLLTSAAKQIGGTVSTEVDGARLTHTLTMKIKVRHDAEDRVAG
ncbi:chemotaxis protein CheB [Agrobacterium rosae]|nr:chemotaxis protein CheB [Agrobacterium rosae]